MLYDRVKLLKSYISLLIFYCIKHNNHNEFVQKKMVKISYLQSLCRLYIAEETDKKDAALLNKLQLLSWFCDGSCVEPFVACMGHNYWLYLNNLCTGGERIHRLTKTLEPLWDLSWLGSKLAVALPSGSPFTLSHFSTLVSTLSTVFLTSLPDYFLMEPRIELLQRGETYCSSHWNILSS